MLFNKTSQAVDRYPLGQELSDNDRQRLLRYTIYWQYYLGRHWAWKREEGEPQITLNYVRAFVDKMIIFMWGKGFDLIIPDKTRSVVEPVLRNIWKENNQDLWGWECAQMGSVTGDVFIKVTWEEPNEFNGIKKGRVRLIVLNSSHSFPRWDEHDRNIMKEFKLLYEYDQAVGTRSSSKETQPKRVRYIETITKDTIRIKDGDKPEKEIKHNLGFVPIVHIKNTPVSGAFFGLSDCGDLVPINREFNEKITNISDIINYHQAPVTLIFGAKASNLEKGANKVWSGLPKDAKVENLNMTTDLAGTTAYLGTLKKALHEIGHVPEGTLGDKQAISNTSAVALEVQYEPLIEMKAIKTLTYGNGLSTVHRMALKLWEMKTGKDLKSQVEGYDEEEDDIYDTKVYFRDTLPKDRLTMLQEIMQRMAMPYPLITPPMALKMMGEEKPEKILEEIEKWIPKMRAVAPAGESPTGTIAQAEGSATLEPAVLGRSKGSGVSSGVAASPGGGPVVDTGVNLGTVRTTEFHAGKSLISSYRPLGI